MAYNPYNEIKRIYNAKTAYGNAQTDEERKRQNEIAESARKTLTENGYADIAERTGASNANAEAVEKVMKKWQDYTDTVTGNYKTGVSNPAYNQKITEASNKNNAYNQTVQKDHDKINDKYYELFDYANSDVTKSDEYKSSFKNIMPSYELSAMNGRKSSLASGAATNGGNIDSFSAANALRQQASITAKGQQAAHQAGLEAYQARIQNAKSILSDLGVYNTGVYSAMSDTVTNDRAAASDIFTNEQTDKNNDVARKSEIASVTGVTPDEWAVSNNPYMNDDGTIKDEYKNIDFSVVMKNAKEAGNTEAYNAAAVARYYKIMGDYDKYGKYDDGNYAVSAQKKTEAARQFDEQIAQADRALSAELEKNRDDNQNALEQISLQNQYDTYNALGGLSSSKSSSSKSATESATENKNAIDATLSHWLYSPRADFNEEEEWKEGYSDGTHKTQYIAAEKMADPETRSSIRFVLLNNGYSDTAATNKMKEYENNIAIEIAKIEGKDYTNDYTIEKIKKRYGFGE